MTTQRSNEYSRQEFENDQFGQTGTDKRAQPSIAVVPCPDVECASVGGCGITIDGTYLLSEPRRLDRSIGKFKSPKFWCGTEAEALAKKAELEGGPPTKEEILNAHKEGFYKEVMPHCRLASMNRPPEERVTHEQASEAALSLIDHFFKNERRRVKACIPAEQDDTDVLLMRYIRQQQEREPSGENSNG